jgi:hypothetical protein
MRMVLAKVGLVAAIVFAVPIVPGLPDLDPSPPPSEQPQPSPQPEPAPFKPPPPSKEARRVCDRMAAPWGSDRAAGTASRPFRSARKLVGALRPGWTGCLRAGTYSHSEVVVRMRKVTLRSAPGERALWRGRLVLAGRRQRLMSLTLDGTSGRRSLPSPTLNGPGIVVSDNDITNRRGICINVRAWYGLRADGFVIQRNRIHDCGRRPPTNHDHGIYVVDAVGGLIRDNVIFRNADRGVQLFPDAQGVTVVRNTIDGNGSGVIVSNDSSRNVIRDNVISHSVVRWNAETHRLRGVGNRFESNCLRPDNPDPGYNENGGMALPPIVAQSGNVVTERDPYRARANGDYTPVDEACGGRGAHGSARKPR